jgi:acyl-CoA synthetase (AMP-forming)/AMP-acid ligase II
VSYPAVLDAVVFDVPDQEWGQRIEAAVVPRPETNLDPSDLRDFTLRALQPSKTPDRFWPLSELPCTETGKFPRRKVPA